MDAPSSPLLDHAALNLEFIAMGDCRVTAEPSLGFSTILGSCIAVCARHPASGVGGVNHFLLPIDPEGEVDPEDARARRYGAFAIEELLNRVAVEAGGVDRRALEIKAFGGAQVMAGTSLVGQSNIALLRAVLARDGLTLAGRDLGGRQGRKLIYHPATGRAWSRLLKSVDEAVVRAEADHARRAAAPAPDVELFD